MTMAMAVLLFAIGWFSNTADGADESREGAWKSAAAKRPRYPEAMK
jgi:hypothetical protein